ncbi:MAG: DNA repair protein RecO [Clostridiales bacterium]|nr:DNA repair protein RecO [Clostridiales bacterium]
MHVVTRGLVLREVNYKESDKILTVLAEGQGKRTVKARGCRRRSSPLAASAQLLVWSDMTLFDYRDYWSLNEASTLSEFRGVREDLEKLALGSYFAEAAEAVAEEGVETPGLLPLVLNSLYALDKLHKPLKLVKAAFELKLLCLAGYEPLLDACAVCGVPEPEEPRLNLSAGVLHCARCREGVGEGEVSMPLDAPALAAMRHVVYGDPKRLFSFALPGESLERLAGVSESFLLTQLERGFRTLDFYKSIQARGAAGGCYI